MSAGERYANGGSTRAGRADREAEHGAAGEPSVAEMLSALTTDASLLVRQEVELAKAEIREEAKQAARGGGMLGAAGVLGHMSLLLLSFAVAWALASFLHPGLAFLIVAIVHAAAAGLLAVAGRQRLQQAQPVPEQTVDTVKEDVEWARDRTR